MGAQREGLYGFFDWNNDVLALSDSQMFIDFDLNAATGFTAGSISGVGAEAAIVQPAGSWELFLWNGVTFVNTGFLDAGGGAGFYHFTNNAIEFYLPWSRFASIGITGPTAFNWMTNSYKSTGGYETYPNGGLTGENYNQYLLSLPSNAIPTPSALAMGLPIALGVAMRRRRTR